MFRIVVLYQDGEMISKNFKTKEELDTWFLGLTKPIKHYRVMNKITKQLIETETGRKNKEK